MEASVLQDREDGLESLATFIAMDRRLAFSRGETLPRQSVGSVLLADVSGFTLLTETLAKVLGSQLGPEALSRHLDSVYSRLIAEVHACRGSVVTFSGDAITCWIDGGDGRCATASALAMQQRMAELPPVEVPGRPPVRLAVKVAVAHGTVSRLLVGAPHVHTFDVIAGPPLDRASAAESLARQGEVLVDSRVVESLGGDGEVTEWRQDAEGHRFAVVVRFEPRSPRRPSWPDVASGTLGEEQVRPFLDPEIYHRLSHGQAPYLAELRSVVPLFLSFGGFDFENDASAPERLDRYVRTIQAVVHRRGGSLIDLTTCAREIYLFAAFGAPIAHEDDAARAVAAALELRDLSLTTPGLSNPRIGLSQGRLYAGPSGSARRRTYTALGDETNLAARLMAQARGGQILASDRVARAASGFRFQALQTLTLKGKQEPMTLHEVLGPRCEIERETASNGHLPLVGRQRECELLGCRLYRLIERKEPALVILEGDAGIGKSRLVEHLLEVTATLGLEAFAGAADAIENATPYYAWRPIWRRLFALETERLDAEGPPTADRARKIVGALDGSRWLQLAPLLNPILDLDLPPTELSAELQGRDRAESTRQLLLALLRHFAARRPLLLVVEDAHWLDSASWELVETLASTCQDLPLVLVLATRGSALREGTAARRLLERPGTHHLHLEPLSPTHVLELVRQCLGVTDLPAPLVDFLHEKSDGNPFFSEELALALRDAGWIRVAGDRCRLAPEVGDLQSLPLPATVEGVVASRLDRLSAPEQLTVKVASVIGRIFSRELLHDVYPKANTRPPLDAHLDRLEQLEIARPYRGKSSGDYIFKHVLTREAAYRRLVPAQRRELHRAIARWLEDHRPFSRAQLDPLLAHHWTRAAEAALPPSPGLLARAIDSLEAAGEQALSTNASREVIRNLEQALAFDDTLRQRSESRPLASTDSRRSRWLSGVGEAYLALGDMPRSHAAFSAALTLLGEPVFRRSGSLAVQAAREVAAQIWHHIEPAALRRRTATDRHRRRFETAARSHHRLAEIHYFDDRLGFFLHALRFANLAVRAGPAELAEGYAAMSVVTSARPLSFLSDFYLRKAGALDTARLPPRFRGQMLTKRAAAEFCHGRWDRVRNATQEGIDLSKQVGDPHSWGMLMSLNGLTTMLVGDLDRGHATLRQLAETARESYQPTQLLWGLCNLAVLALRRGRPQDTESLIEEALHHLETEKNLIFGILCFSYLSEARLRLADFAAAREAVDRASEQIAAQGSALNPQAIWAYNSHAQTRLGLWRRALTENHPTRQLRTLALDARDACRKMQAMGRMVTIARPAAWHCTGVFAQLSGKPRRARRAWHKSLAAATGLAMPFEQAQAHLELGRSLPEDDPSRQHHLSSADEILRRIGAAQGFRPTG